jgi:hypothetical protein
MKNHHYYGISLDLATRTRDDRATQINQRNQDRIDSGRDDDSFLSQKAEQIQLSELDMVVQAAESGWKQNFKVLCSVDTGEPVEFLEFQNTFGGKTIKSFGFKNPQNCRMTFVDELLIQRSRREGNSRSNKTLENKGLVWKEISMPVMVRTSYAGTGVASLWTGQAALVPYNPDKAAYLENLVAVPSNDFHNV